ncbi:MAG: molybdopterin-dependent oxidoreductase, partial [Gammaproteobacteria bacterium]|nr:molybdopterin-dependent oxidoreductase [Gammaproteobacteria bacterium]
MKRRDFLKYTGTGIGVLQAGIPRAVAGKVVSVGDPLAGGYPDRSWEDFYRRELEDSRGDARGFAFHCVNCQGNCAWEVYAKDGRVVREEQLGAYPPVSWEIPDANPRGCNKGAIHSQAMYEKDRLRYPLKRAGERGAGRWERVSWDEALTDIAERVVGTLVREGPGGLMLHAGTGIMSQGRRAGPLRLGSLLGAIRLYPSSAVGDMFTGATLAYGIPNVGISTDAWFEMDYIVLWGVNPNATRIPDAHYIWEGRYNKAKVVTIAPDYNATSIHADQWVPIQPGNDSFLAMSLVHTVFEEELYKASFVKEQTDLPFLVRRDNGKLLRASDMRAQAPDDEEEANPEEIFYFWDRKAGKAVAAPGSRGSPRDTLRLGNLDPALTGRYTVEDAEGRRIEVSPVFELAREEAASFPPEETRRHTGIHPDVVRGLAREFAGAGHAGITVGFSIHKYAWGILTTWAQALLCALTGQETVDTEHQWSLGNMGPLVSPKPPRFQSGFLGEWFAGRMAETFRRHYDDAEAFRRKAGLGPEDLAELAKRSVDTDWLLHYGEPSVRIMFGDNTFRRNKSEEHYRQTVLDATDLYVNVNWRMDSSAEWADYVLPVPSHYEIWDIRADVGYHRHGNLNVPPEGLDPVGEARSEWEICKGLANRIQEVAVKRGVEKLEDSELTVETDDGGEEPVVRELDRLHEDFTMAG